MKSTFAFKRMELVRVIRSLMSSLVLFGFPGLLAVAAAAELPSYDRVRNLDSARTISDAKFIDQEGKPFHLGQLRNRVVLVFFGFTHCPDVCPTAMAKFRQFEQSGRIDAGEVAFVLISVDGERDTPEVLKEYLAKFSPRFIGLTGEPGQVKALAKEFRASFYRGQVSESDGSYSMMHSPQAFVLDRNGRLRAEFYNPSLDAMAGVTSALLAE